jgi:hypothetical protein
VVRVGKRALRNRIMIALAALAFVAIFFFNVPFPIIIIAAGVIGYFGAKADGRNFAGGGARRRQERRGRRQLLGEELPDHVRPSVARALRVARVWLLLWLVPVALLIAFGPGQRVQPDRAVLQQDGDGDVRRRLCGAGLCRAAGGRALSLAQARARCSTASAWPRPRRAR